MARSLRKGPFFDAFLISHPSFSNTNSVLSQNQPVLKIWSRRSLILPSFVGYSFQVHNGKTFITVPITDEMIGHKFGEFAATRKKGIHKQKGKK